MGKLRGGYGSNLGTNNSSYIDNKKISHANVNYTMSPDNTTYHSILTKNHHMVDFSSLSEDDKLKLIFDTIHDTQRNTYNLLTALLVVLIIILIKIVKKK